MALDAIPAPLNQLVNVSTSATAVDPESYPRIKGSLESWPYAAVVRFPVQPGGQYTLLNVFPAVEDDWRILVTGYFPLSRDDRREQGAAGSVSGQRGARFSDTGLDARRMNLTIAPTSEGTSLYVVYYSSKPSEQFQLQLSSPQTPDKEVEGISAVHPYTKRQNVSWGSVLGEFWSARLPDEPPAGTTPGGGTTGTTTKIRPGEMGDRPGDGNSSGGVAIQVDAVRVAAGATVNVPVRLLNGRDVASLNVVVTYDARLVTPLSAPERGPIFAPLSVVLFESNSDRPAAMRFGHATTELLSGTGVLATLPFRAIGQPGSRAPLELEVPALHDSQGRPITVQLIPGEVTIEGNPPPPTRTTGTTGVPTVEDARNALRMSVRLIPEDLALDVDRDSVVTANDARILLARAVASSTSR